jgi:hypothetical protein
MPAGNQITLGTLPDGATKLRSRARERDKHLYVCGSTGTGKSKFLEHLIRQDILSWSESRCGLLLLDPHGSLYDCLIDWLAWHNLDVPVVPIDLRQDDYTVAYNLLRPRPIADPGVITSNFVQAMAYAWGQSGVTETPRLAHWASTIVRTLYEKKLTLLEAEYLIDHSAKDIRRLITADLPEGLLTRAWATADALTPSQFEEKIESTVNRLHSFLSTRVLRQMFGQDGPSLDLGQAMEDGSIVLVSLATKNNRVSEQDAALFATLLLSDLWTAARERGKKKPKPFYVYVDEFQNFVTPTIAKNLDQARGFGLHLTLAHQFPNQLLHTGDNGKQVYDSIFENARSKVVFSLQNEENLRPLALDLFRGVFDPDKIKLELHATKVMGYEEDTRTVRSHGTSSGQGGGSQSGKATGAGFGHTMTTGGPGQLPASHSESEFASHSHSDSQSWASAENESESEVPVLMPVVGKELSSVQFESLEEQLHRAMAVLHDRQQRHAVARLVDMRGPVCIAAPTVKTYPTTPEMVAGYLRTMCAKLPFVLPTSEAEKRVKERAERFKAARQEPASAKRKVK